MMLLCSLHSNLSNESQQLDQYIAVIISRSNGKGHTIKPTL